MSMKNYKQLMEDAATNEELAKKLAEADRQVRKTGDKTVYIKAAAELGYEVTDKDFPGDDLVKLDEGELDDAAGGILWFGDDAEDGHEIGCIAPYYKDIPVPCPNSPSRKHCLEKNGERIPCQGCENGKAKYVCKYCGEWTFISDTTFISD